MGEHNRQYYSYQRAKTIVRKVGLASMREYYDWHKTTNTDIFIPANPIYVYGKRFGGTTEWLGKDIADTSVRKPRGDYKKKSVNLRNGKDFLPYEEASQYMQEIGIRSYNQWREYITVNQIPNNIPIAADQHYTKQGSWQGWSHYFGKGYVSYDEAKRLIANCNFSTIKAYIAYIRENKLNLHSKPDTYYAEWEGWSVYLNVKNMYAVQDVLSFKKARKLARKFGFKNHYTYCRYVQENTDLGLPKRPEMTYSDKGWIGWGDFLGNGQVAPNNRVILPYKEAKRRLKQLGIKTSTMYLDMYYNGELPSELPSNPDNYYTRRNKWKGWGKFLAKDKTK